MGTYTFDTFRDGLKLEMGQRADLESPVNWYSAWINAAYLGLTTRDRFFDMKKSFWFPQLEADKTEITTVGIPYVITPVDALVVRRIWNTTDDAKLGPMTKDEYYNTLSKNTVASRKTPTKYVRLGANIYLSPTPDDSTTNLVIYYRKIPAILTEADDVTILGPEWDEPILKLAAIQSYQRLKEYDFAEIERKAWVEDVTNLIGIYNQEERAGETILGPDNRLRSAY